ncbi:hypothetical protein VH569_13290 [Azospirillum sp. 11R-A]|uniref:hypothetical protein n=1 Tax=Azospirillum sp. 11R-A TaxID=3111634 RepID=UPI003C1BEE98
MMADYAFTIAEAWRMLRGYSDALAIGGTPSSMELGRRLGISSGKSVILRRACIQLGWIVVVHQPHGSWPGELALTAAGRIVAKLAEPPSGPVGRLHVDRAASSRQQQRRQPQPAPASASSKAAYRRCLSCGEHFASDGPQHRICNRCKGTEEFRSAPTTFALRL